MPWECTCGAVNYLTHKECHSCGRPLSTYGYLGQVVDEMKRLPLSGMHDWMALLQSEAKTDGARTESVLDRLPAPEYRDTANGEFREMYCGGEFVAAIPMAEWRAL